jgi:hypothetical protein
MLLILLTRQISLDKDQKAAPTDCLGTCACRLFVHAELLTGPQHDSTLRVSKFLF